MSNIEYILEFVSKQPGCYCDECIVKKTGIRPHQQVNTICNNLAKQGKLHRDRGICAGCHKNSILNIPIHRGFSTTAPLYPKPTNTKPNLPTPDNTGNPLSITPQQFEQRVNWFVDRYFNTHFSEQALDLGRGKMHRFDLVSPDNTIILECKSYTWTSGGNYPSGKVATLKETLFYFRSIAAKKKILVMHHKEFPKKELLADVFFRQNRQLFGDVELWDYHVASDPQNDTVRIITSGNKIIRLPSEGAI